jgi:hypothetical protein
VDVWVGEREERLRAAIAHAEKGVAKRDCTIELGIGELLRCRQGGRPASGAGARGKRCLGRDAARIGLGATSRRLVPRTSLASRALARCSPRNKPGGKECFSAHGTALFRQRLVNQGMDERPVAHNLLSAGHLGHEDHRQVLLRIGDDRAGKLASFDLFIRRGDDPAKSRGGHADLSGSARGNGVLAGEPAVRLFPVVSVMSLLPVLVLIMASCRPSGFSSLRVAKTWMATPGHDGKAAAADESRYRAAGIRSLV